MRGRKACLCGWFHQLKPWFAQIWKGRHKLLGPWFETQWQDNDSDLWKLCDAMGFKSKNKQGYYGSVLCMYESSWMHRDVCLMPRRKFGSDTMLNILVMVVLCYTMLYMLKWMWKGKHRIWILRTWGLRGSAFGIRAPDDRVGYGSYHVVHALKLVFFQNGIHGIIWNTPYIYGFLFWH